MVRSRFTNGNLHLEADMSKKSEITAVVTLFSYAGTFNQPGHSCNFRF